MLYPPTHLAIPGYYSKNNARDEAMVCGSHSNPAQDFKYDPKSLMWVLGAAMELFNRFSYFSRQREGLPVLDSC